MNKKPRWINEVPGIKETGKKRELTYEEKKEAEKFEKAVKSGNIKEWFNSNK
ncbi:MAG: hypothetical protein J6K45_04665 [Clostridia bacterium]|nr:hypothetical protein [Clostridia bacterium]